MSQDLTPSDEILRQVRTQLSAQGYYSDHITRVSASAWKSDLGDGSAVWRYCYYDHPYFPYRQDGVIQHAEIRAIVEKTHGLYNNLIFHTTDDKGQPYTMWRWNP